MKHEHATTVGDGDELALQRADMQLADRLDRLSVPMAENVLRRAIDLHQDQTFDDSTIGWKEIETVGAELGIDTATLRQALLHELETEQDDTQSVFDQLFAPGTVTGGIVAEADAATVLDRLDTWMREHEGMSPVRRRGGAVMWEPSSLLQRLLRGAGNSGELRSHGPVTTRVSEVGSGDQLVEISLDAHQVKTVVIAILAAFAGLGVAIGAWASSANSFDALPTALEFLVPMLASVGIGVGVAWTAARSRLRQIKRGINQALDGIVHFTTLKKRKHKGSHGKTPRWREIVEEIFEEVVDEIFD